MDQRTDRGKPLYKCGMHNGPQLHGRRYRSSNEESRVSIADLLPGGKTSDTLEEEVGDAFER